MMNSIKHIYHIVFRTRDNNMTIPENSKNVLLGQVYKICSHRRWKVHAANSCLNHLHLLMELTPKDDERAVVNKLKASTASYCRTSGQMPDFTNWAPGYSSFTVSYCELRKLKQYITDQRLVHQSLSFEEEQYQLEDENGISALCGEDGMEENENEKLKE